MTAQASTLAFSAGVLPPAACQHTFSILLTFASPLSRLAIPRYVPAHLLSPLNFRFFSLQACYPTLCASTPSQPSQLSLLLSPGLLSHAACQHTFSALSTFASPLSRHAIPRCLSAHLLSPLNFCFSSLQACYPTLRASTPSQPSQLSLLLSPGLLSHAASRHFSPLHFCFFLF